MDFEIDRLVTKNSRLALYGIYDALNENLESEDMNLETGAPPEKPITWGSGIDTIETMCGGFYGMTTVFGDKGSGKSTLALSSAIRAASEGWEVVYFAAEDDYDGVRERFDRFLKHHPEIARTFDFKRFHPFQVGRRTTPAHLADMISLCVDPTEDRPVLSCIDSINTVVNLGGSRGYLERLGNIALWAALARRRSRGRAAFLFTSEQNKQGGAKGDALGYWSDVFLQIKKESEDIVSMELHKSRRTGGEGPMGKFERAWWKGCFDRPDAPMRVIAGGLAEA